MLLAVPQAQHFYLRAISHLSAFVHVISSAWKAFKWKKKSYSLLPAHSYSSTKTLAHHTWCSTRPRAQLLGTDLRELFVQAQIHRAWCYRALGSSGHVGGTEVGESQGMAAREKKQQTQSLEAGKHGGAGGGSCRASSCPARLLSPSFCSLPSSPSSSLSSRPHC